MSSALQFKGKVSPARGFRLEFYLVDEVRGNPDDPNSTWIKEVDRELVDCTECDQQHPQLYTAWRVPAGIVGQWVTFRYLGEEHVPDLSIPIPVPRLPRTARRMSNRENSLAWHRE